MNNRLFPLGLLRQDIVIEGSALVIIQKVLLPIEGERSSLRGRTHLGVTVGALPEDVVVVVGVLRVALIDLPVVGKSLLLGTDVVVHRRVVGCRGAELADNAVNDL